MQVCGVCVQLTELKALLGCVGQVRFVMGCISQLQDGRYFLEDMSDSLPIDMSEAQTTSGFFTGDSVLLYHITLLDPLGMHHTGHDSTDLAFTQ